MQEDKWFGEKLKIYLNHLFLGEEASLHCKSDSIPILDSFARQGKDKLAVN